MVGPMVAQVPVTGTDTQPIKAEKYLTARPTFSWKVLALGETP